MLGRFCMLGTSNAELPPELQELTGLGYVLAVSQNRKHKHTKLPNFKSFTQWKTYQQLVHAQYSEFNGQN